MNFLVQNLAIFCHYFSMKSSKKDPQSNLFSIQLEQLLDHQDPLYQLACKIDWRVFEREFGPLFCEDNGRPAKPIRLMVGLQYLKATFGESDETVVEKWVQNPYWQYFCGETEFQHDFPIEPTTMGKWRKRIQSSGLEKLLEESIRCALKAGVITKHDLKRVNVDTTVLEKAITFPTDAKLYHRMREKLVKAAKERDIKLRQTYVRKGKKALLMQNRYRHARQMKRANRELRKLKTFFRRVLRDVDRKATGATRDIHLQELLELAYRLFKQNKNDKNKIYSLHAPEVECIAKGKAHKKYEFGCKGSFVTSSKGNFILGAMAHHGNPFDGHTLKGALDQANGLIPGKNNITYAYVDQGYRGHGCKNVDVNVVGRNQKKAKASVKRWMKRRAAIEPIIGHMKNDYGSDRNWFLGKDGDQIYALMMGYGFNMRKLLKAFFLSLSKGIWVLRIGLTKLGGYFGSSGFSYAQPNFLNR
jgi:transposase, IS5 family